MQHYLKTHAPSLFLGVVMLTYLILRAIITPISDDEFLTWREHVHQDILTILTNGNPYVYWAPNNHILNTLLLKSSLFIFGEQDWAFRIHVLIAFVICYYFMFRIMSGFVSSPLRIAAYLGIIFLNLYLLDFFSIARGYAMSMAAWAGATYYFTNYSQQPSTAGLLRTILCLFLAVWANFSALYFLPIFGCLFLFSIYQWRKKIAAVKHLALVAAGLSIIVAIVAMPLTKAFEAGTLVWGKGILFYDIFVSSVDNYFHYNHKLGRFEQVSENWSRVEVVTVVLMVLWSALQLICFKFTAPEKTRRQHLQMLFQCFGVIIIVCALHTLFKTPYPLQRTALLFSFPFLLSLILAFEITIVCWKYAQIWVWLIFAFAAWHCSEAWNLDNTREWYQNGDAKRVFAYLRAEMAQKSPGEKLIIGVDPWQYFSMAYYEKTIYKDKLELQFSELDKPAPVDYLFVPTHLADKAWKGCQMAKKFRHAILFKCQRDSLSSVNSPNL